MSAESDFIASLRGLASARAARGLIDDAAVLEFGGAKLILTHDMIVEGVHFLADEAPGDVAWKLVAVNLSDLAGKGARPIGVLLGFSLRDDAAWDKGFADGLSSALQAFELDLLGGDTVAIPSGAPRCLGLTAIGASTERVPSRSDAHAGEMIWVSGSIGDAGAGLRLAIGQGSARDELRAQLIERYRAPRPRLEAGWRLTPLVGAMMDISDGLLIDASRLAEASGVRAIIELDSIPLSPAFLEVVGGDRAARIKAATAGDDYELLFTAPPDVSGNIESLAAELGLPLTKVGRMEPGTGLALLDAGEAVALPDVLGFEH
ncbi:MAG TPA: thiamine-phosphate kinase [Allosphingosinicella sp.]|nr:thiamine-phosphate kinase [Allosphingosinicella sp.]